MGFSKHLHFYRIPEWSDYYFDYETIKAYLNSSDKFTREKRKKKKKNLKLLEINDEMMSFNQEKTTFRISEVQNNLSFDDNKRMFIEKYKEDLRKNEEFYNKKLEEYRNDFDNLAKKIAHRAVLLAEDEEEDEAAKRANEKVNAERDEFGYAVSWKRAMSQLFNYTTWLHSYCTVNSISRQKIRNKANKINPLLRVQLDNIDQKYFKRDDNDFERDSFIEMIKTEDYNAQFGEMTKEINILRNKIKNLYAKEFTKNDVKRAYDELDSRLKGNRTKHKKLISFYIGMIVATVLFLLISFYINDNMRLNNLVPYFPAFNFSFVIIFILIGIGFNLAILRKYRINYLYIMEVEPRKRLGAVEMFQNSLMVLTIWTLLFTLMIMIPDSYCLFGLIIVTALFTFFFFPFHFGYFEFRKGILNTLFLNFFPIGINSVKFKDFLFGDILTSLNKPFASLVLSFCLFSCDECRAENKRSPLCSRNTMICLIFLFAPFLIRFCQCLNRFYYTKKPWPHLGNTLKYIGGMANVVCAWLYENHKEKDDWEMYFILHISIGTVATSYMLFWDFKMDWNLGECEYGFLRKVRIYPTSWYYAVIIINALLRFTWTLNLFSFDTANPYVHVLNEGRNFVFGILEAYRRIQWCIFRIENESINNPDEYRDVLEVPALVD